MAFQNGKVQSGFPVTISPSVGLGIQGLVVALDTTWEHFVHLKKVDSRGVLSALLLFFKGAK